MCYTDKEIMSHQILLKQCIFRQIHTQFEMAEKSNLSTESTEWLLFFKTLKYQILTTDKL